MRPTYIFLVMSESNISKLNFDYNDIIPIHILAFFMVAIQIPLLTFQIAPL